MKVFKLSYSSNSQTNINWQRMNLDNKANDCSPDNIVSSLQSPSITWIMRDSAFAFGRSCYPPLISTGPIKMHSGPSLSEEWPSSRSSCACQFDAFGSDLRSRKGPGDALRSQCDADVLTVDVGIREPFMLAATVRIGVHLKLACIPGWLHEAGAK